MTKVRKRNVARAVLTMILLCGGLCSSLAATDALVGHWKFDESSGTSASDASANSNTGTLTDMDTATCWVNGKVNGGLIFDGCEDYVSVAHDSSLAVSGKEISIEAWVKPDTRSSYHVIACKGSYTYFLATQSARVALLIGDPDGGWNTICFGHTTLDSSKWYHLAGTYKNGIAKVYVNGALDGTAVGDDENIRSNTLPLSIGSASSYSSDYFFEGTIDEVKIYERALLQKEILDSLSHGKWRFSESSGSTAADDSPYSNNGILTNMDTSTCWVNGKSTNALFFDGAGDYVDCGSDSSLDVGATGTVSAWIKVASCDGLRGIICKGNGTGTSSLSYALYLKDSGGSKLKWQLSDGTNYIQANFDTVPAVDTWYHIALSWDGDYVRAYVNGVEETSSPWAQTVDPQTGNNQLILGAFTTTGPYKFHGTVDEINLFEQALTEQEIQQYYYEVDLKAEWNFDELSGSSLPDVSGNGNTGTLNNFNTASCWVDGRIGKALVLDGNDDYISIPHSSSLNISGSEISLEAWVKPDTASSYHSIVNKGGYSCFLSVYCGRATLLVGNPDSYTWNTLTYGSTVLDSSKWYHIVGTYKNGTGKVYVNGVLDGTDTGDDVNIRTNTSAVYIGSYNSTYLFNGTIDQVNIFSRALSVDEIGQRFEDHGGEYGFGCEEQPTGDPIGGGTGYSYILSANDGDYVVSTKAGLLSALTSAQSGEIIFIDGSCTLDFTTEKANDADFMLSIPAGVTIASDRGYSGSSGALLKTDTITAGDYYNTLLLAGGSGVRLTGLRLQGPQDVVDRSPSANDYSDGIRSAYSDLEVDNCEISAWGHAAVAMLDGGTDAYIHHNYIHHCQRDGLGYGISHGYGDATSLIEANKFDYNRHSVAGAGTTGNSYEARYNLVLENATGHSFDMHGGSDRGDQTNIAGDNIYIHHNTVMVVGQYAVFIRGIPNNEALIYNNLFFYGDVGVSAIQRSPYGNFQVYHNLHRAERIYCESE